MAFWRETSVSLVGKLHPCLLLDEWSVVDGHDSITLILLLFIARHFLSDFDAQIPGFLPLSFCLVYCFWRSYPIPVLYSTYESHPTMYLWCLSNNISFLYSRPSLYTGLQFQEPLRIRNPWMLESSALGPTVTLWTLQVQISDICQAS